VLGLLKQSALNWIAHKDARLGAALAYYSIFSLAPVILIAIAVAGFFFDTQAVQAEVRSEVQELLGPAGAQAVETMLASAAVPRKDVFATLFGVGLLLFAAVGVVVQLKDALNTVWEVTPERESGIWNFIRTYIVSAAALLAVGFLLLVSLVLTAVLAVLGKHFPFTFPEAALQSGSALLSFCVITLLFAMMFRWLPDAEVHWRDAIPGGALTAAAFEIGKLLIGFYIGKQALNSTFGAAASLVVVLIWTYYSAQIVLFGAEFTRAYALRRAGSAS